jgi:2'-hydroxyisoflavone reductase
MPATWPSGCFGMGEARHAGTFNVTGPAAPLTMGELLSTIVEVTGSDSALTWVPESFLLEHGVAPWAELPLWLPEEMNGMMSVNFDKAREAGLAPRPVAELIRDTMLWLRSHSAPTGQLASGVTPAGLSRERETELLGEWARRRSSWSSGLRVAAR